MEENKFRKFELSLFNVFMFTLITLISELCSVNAAETMEYSFRYASASPPGPEWPLKKRIYVVYIILKSDER